MPPQITSSPPPAPASERPLSSFAIDVPETLLARVRAGEGAAFEQIYRWFERPVFTLAVRIAGDRDDEVALFDTHNRARQAGIALIYAARENPDELPLSLPDLRSRLSQCTRIVLSPLDDAGRGEVLRQRAQRRGLALEEAALDWLLKRVDRDLGGLTALLDKLDRASLAAQRRITVPFLRQTLGAE
ncbi:hypothetical protein AB4084_02905 [Lysobacter sp. 2RAB21]